MKKLLFLLCMIFAASHAYGAQYYLSPSGTDSNSGTSVALAWLTPNHPVNCGDTIIASVGTYSASNFGSGNWGTVTCATGLGVAWVQCASFDGCKISTTSANGMQISANRWGVAGFEATSSWTNGSCFTASSGVNHVVYANNVANGCQNGGVSLNGGDYDIVVGNIIYNAASTSAVCTSGITMWEPSQADTVAGTHMYVAGNFSYSNLNPNPCAGTAPTDGEGIIFDTFNHGPYCQQVVAQNNMLLGNGGRGIMVNSNTCAAFYLKNNTTYGNNNQSGQLFPAGLGEITVNASDVTSTGNLDEPATGTVGSNAIYAFSLAGSLNTTSGNWLYGPTGNNTTGSGYGANTTGTNPAFHSTTIPAAPSCSGTTSAVACAATMIANFTPTATGTSAYGYQAVSNTSIVDTLFPQWLCSGNALVTGFPSGIVTPGCGTPTYTVNASMSTSTLQSAFNAAAVGSTVTFAPGTYNITGALNLKCGVTYTGPVATPATAILNATYSRPSVDTFNFPASSCSQMTTVEYFDFLNGGGIYVNTSFSNMTITHNQFGNIPCCGRYVEPQTAAIYIDAASGTPATEIATNFTITNNVIGDSTSCTTGQSAGNGTTPPTANAMTAEGNLAGSPNPYLETIEGNCQGIGIYASINGLVIENNVIGPIGEGVHFLCTSSQCEPSGSPAGATTKNVTAMGNDFVGIHRIAWEEQPQATQNVLIEYNSEHDPTNPYYGNYALSMACCDTGATAPGATVINNTWIQNSAANSGGRYGYGLEAWGNNAIYSNNLIQQGSPVGQGGGSNPQAIAWCYGMNGGTVSNNTVQGPNYSFGSSSCGGTNAIGNECINNGSSTRCGSNPPWSPLTVSGNSTNSAVSAFTSVAPTISPSSGSYPITVTLADPGYTSGPEPLGNTSIWYTTDGSTPSAGGGTSQLYTAPIRVTSATTVKAVGMWGTGANTRSYSSSYGFVPSGVVSATYSGGTSATLTGVTVGCANGATTVGAGSSLACAATCTYSGLPSTNCTTGDQYGTVATFASSNTADFTVNASGVVSGVAAGTANLTTTAGSFTSSPLALAVTAPAPVLQSVYIDCGGVNTLSAGQTVQCSAKCTYSGSITTNCTTTDTYGTTAGSWTSSAPADATVSSAGLVTAVAAGSSNIRVSANSFTSNIYTFTLSGGSPPAATLTGVAITGANTVTAGQTLSLGAQCTYSDLSTTNCTTADAHGTTAGTWASSATGVATINSTTGVLTGVAAGTTNVTVHAGSFTSTAVTITVTAVPATTICGVNQVTTSLGGYTSANYFNSTYCVTGSATAGYNSTSGGFYLPAGTQVSNALWDLVVIPATSGTTQAAAAICKGTYTTSGTAAPGAWITVPIGQLNSPSTACHLAPSTAYWIGLITNQSGTPGQGFYNCGGSCTGAVPTSGSGTYGYRYQSNVYGTYTGMNTALLAGGTTQSSQYITLGAPPPTLTGGYQKSTPILGLNVITPGVTLQLNAFCRYSDGSTNQCFPTPDQYGNTVTACSSTNPSVLTVASPTSSPPCLVTGISGGAAYRNITLTGGVPGDPYGITTQTSSNNPVPGGSHRPR